MLVQDIHQRLTAALPAGVPVLKPDQLLIPGEWEEETPDGDIKAGGERGLHVYLRQRAPAGYVQIEQPVPITSDGTTATYWCAVAAIHADKGSAALLARAVRHALNGTPYEPGAFREVAPGQPETLAPGAWLVRATYEILTIDGDTAG